MYLLFWIMTADLLSLFGTFELYKESFGEYPQEFINKSLVKRNPWNFYLPHVCIKKGLHDVWKKKDLLLTWILFLSNMKIPAPHSLIKWLVPYKWCRSSCHVWFLNTKHLWRAILITPVSIENGIAYASLIDELWRMETHMVHPLTN